VFLSKYGVARHIYIPIVKRAVVDHAVGADWTPSAGDVKISKDGGASANVTNLPSAIAMGNSAIWDFSLTATEMQAAQIVVTVADSATKAVEDTAFIIETHGNASGQFQIDLADSVRAGLTALPNAAAEAAGGLYTRGTGAGQINQDANGRVDVSMKAILGTTLTETAGQIAAAFKKFFDKASPTGTINSLPDAVPGAAGALLIDDVWTDARAAKLDNLDATVSSRNATAPLDAAGTRAAVGLASANLDTQLGAIAGYVDTEITDIQSRLPAALVGGRMDCSVGAFASGQGPRLRKNVAFANFAVLMRDSTNHAPATGKTLTATRSIDGGAFGAGTIGAVTEVSSGVYVFDLGAGDLNGNQVTIRVTAAGCDDLVVTVITNP
jgi:hypothetical protein